MCTARLVSESYFRTLSFSRLVFLDGRKVVTVLVVALIFSLDLDLKEVHAFGSMPDTRVRRMRPQGLAKLNV
jgi:hypothetical protein